MSQFDLCLTVRKLTLDNFKTIAYYRWFVYILGTITASQKHMVFSIYSFHIRICLKKKENMPTCIYVDFILYLSPAV